MARDSIKIHIDGDDSGFQKSLSGIEKTAKKGFSAVVKGAAAASAGIAALAGVAISNFKEYEQLIGGVDTLFKESSQKVQQNAANAYKTAGMSANEYMQTAMSFSASLKQSFDDTAEGISKAADVADMAVIDMSDNANKMGTDMELIQNAYQGFAKQNYTMLDNLRLGYGGTKTEMERLLADAQKLSGVKYDISNLADVYNAIHVIQTELGITGTTALEASQTIEGSVNMMKASWTNLMTGIADENADFDKLLDEFTDSVMTVGDNIIPVLEKTIEGIGDFVSEAASELLPKTADILIDTLPSLISSVGKLAEGLGEALIECFEQVADNADEIVDAAVEIGEAFIEGLLDFIPKLIDAAGKMISALADALGDAVPILKPLTDVLSFLGDNLKAVTTVVITAVAAFKTFTIVTAVVNAVKGLSTAFQAASAAVTAHTVALGVSKIANVADLAALSAKEIVVGVLTGKIGLATAAQWLWNAAMNSNVIGVVIMAVAALIAIIGVLATTQMGQCSEADRVIAKHNEEIESTQELRKEYEELKASKQEQAEAELVEVANAQVLSQELMNLADASGRVDEKNRARANFILNELNEALGTEFKMVDGQIQKYDELCSSIDGYIEKKHAQILLDAHEETYTNALTNYNDALTKQNNAYAEMKSYIDDLNEAYPTLNLTVEDFIGYTAEQNNALASTCSGQSDLVDMLMAAGKNYKEQAEEVANYSQEITDYSNASIAIQEGNSAKAISLLDKENKSYKTAAQIREEMTEKSMYAVADAYADAVSDVEVAYNNLQACDNEYNRAQLQSAIQYAENLRTVYEEKGGEIVDGMVEGVEGKRTVLNDKSLEIMTAAAEACGASNVDFVEAGKDGVQGIIDGLSDPVMKQKVWSAAYALGALAPQGFRAGEDSNSPSKEFMRAAGDGVSGIVIGLESGKKDVYKAGYSLAETGVKAYNEGQNAHSPAKEYIEASKNTIDGLIEGVEKYKDDFIDAMGDMADDGVSVVKKSLSELEELYLHGEDITGYNVTAKQQAYLDEALRQEQAKEKSSEEIQREAEEWKLKKLEMAAEEEAEILEAAEKERLQREKEAAKERQKILEEEMDACISYFEERTDAALDAMEELADAQEKFREKLYDETELFHVEETTFVGLGENGQDLVVKKPELADLSTQRKELEAYVSLLDAVRDRGGVPDELFSELRDMSIEDGTNYAKALLEASDEDFEAYIGNWKYLKDTTEGLSKEIYDEEAQELYDAFEKEFGQVPEDFFKLGEGAADKFGDGFMEHTRGLLDAFREEVQSSMSILMGPAAVRDSVLAQAMADTNTWNTTYIINSSGKETTRQLLMAARQNNLVERMRTQ